MGLYTNIHWADSTVNGSTGCPGCELWPGPCYAGHLHETRLARSLPALYAPDFSTVRLAPGRLAKAARYSDLYGKPRDGKPWLDGLPRLIFVGDMGDFFAKDIPFDYLKAELIDNARSKPGRRHIWLCLTKQPGRLGQFADWLNHEHGEDWPDNVWCGTSVTRRANLGRLDQLCAARVKTRFASLEPLREAVSVAKWLDGTSGRLDWLIVGGESRQGVHVPEPFDVEWASALVKECHEAQIPIHVKQFGADVRFSPPHPWQRPEIEETCVRCEEWPVGTRFRAAPDGRETVMLRDSHGGDWSEWPAMLRVREFPGKLAERAVGRAAGELMV